MSPAYGRTAWATGGLLLLGLTLRLCGLGRQNAWLDEALSYQLAAGSSWPTGALGDNTPPLYYAILRLSVRLFGDEPWAIRLPSALIGSLAVAATLWWAHRMFDRKTAFWAALFAAIMPMHIYFSQEARAYVLLMLTVTLAFGCLWRCIERDSRGRWLLFAASASLALHSHTFAVLPLAAAASIPIFLGDAAHRRRFAVASAAAAASLAPWAFISARIRRFAPEADWEALEWAWRHTPPWLAIPRSFEVLGIGAQAGMLPIHLKQMTAVAPPSSLRWMGLAALALVVLATVLPWRSPPAGITRLGRKRLALWALVVGPLLALWLVSWVHPLYLVGRYDLVAAPAFAVVVGLGLRRLVSATPAGLGLSVAAILLLTIGHKLYLYYEAPAVRGDSVTAARTLDDHAASGDLVVFVGNRGFPVLYELARLGYRWSGRECEQSALRRALTCRFYPITLDEQGWYRVSTAPVDQQIDQLLFDLRPEGRVHVVLGTYTYSGGRLSAHKDDRPFLAALRQRGFAAEGAEPPAGILRFVRAGDDP